MTPEEKAKAIVDKFKPPTQQWDGDQWEDDESLAKEAALIAVDEILTVISTLDEDSDLIFPNEYIYWEQVKSAIQKNKSLNNNV